MGKLPFQSRSQLLNLKIIVSRVRFNKENRIIWHTLGLDKFTISSNFILPGHSRTGFRKGRREQNTYRRISRALTQSSNILLIHEYLQFLENRKIIHSI